MDGDRHVELDRLGIDRVVHRIAVRLVRPGEGHDEGATAAVLHGALELGCGRHGIAERQMGDRDQPAPGIAAEIGDPAVVGPAIGLAQRDVAQLGLPQDAQGRIEHRRLEAFGVEKLQSLAGVAGAVGHVGGVGLVGMGREGLEVLLSHAAKRGRITAARALARHAADLEILQAVLVALDAKRAVAVLGLDVVVPQRGVLEQVPVGIDGAAMFQTVNRTGIEHGPHQRSSPSIRP